MQLCKNGLQEVLNLLDENTEQLFGDLTSSIYKEDNLHIYNAVRQMIHIYCADDRTLDKKMLQGYVCA